MGRKPFMRRDDDERGYAVVLIDGDPGTPRPVERPADAAQPLVTVDRGEPPPGCRKLAPGVFQTGWQAGDLAAERRVEQWIAAECTADFGPPLRVNDHEPQVITQEMQTAPKCQKHGIALQLCGCGPARDQQSRHARSRSHHDEG